MRDEKISKSPMVRRPSQELGPLLAEKPVVVVIDDVADNLDLVKRALQPDYVVHATTSGTQALEILPTLERVDVLIVDQRMPDMSGSTLLEAVNSTRPDAENIVRVLLTAYSASDDLIAAINYGRVDYYLAKPFKSDELRRMLEHQLALKKRERRRWARVALSAFEAVEISSDNSSSIRDVSPGGFFLETLYPYELGTVLPVSIAFPGGERVEFCGEVVRREPARGGVGVRFVSNEEENRISDLLVGHFAVDDVEELRRRFPFLDPDDLVVFTEPDRIRRHLEESQRYERDLVVSPCYRRQRLFCRLSGIDHAARNITVCLTEDYDTLHVGQSVLISCYDDWRTLSFEASVLMVDPDAKVVQLVYPRVLFYADKRRKPRLALGGEEDRHRVEIEVPHESGRVITGIELNRHDCGMAFEVRQSPGLAFVGAPIPSLRLVKGDEEVWKGSAEIRHISALDDDRFVIGVQLDVRRRSFRPVEPHMVKIAPTPGNSDAAPHPETPAAITGASRADDLQLVTFPNPDGHETVGILNLVPCESGGPVPTVILPPAWGKTKETLFALAMVLVESFRQQGKPLAVLRYDGVNRRGESHHEADSLVSEDHALHATISQGRKDTQGAIEFVRSNPYFSPGAVFVVSFSLAALETRLLLRNPQHARWLDHWIVCVGAPEIRNLLCRVGGNFDIVEAVKLNMPMGMLEYLGVKNDLDEFVKDCLGQHLDGMEAARRDFGSFDLPITWLLGEHDHWINRHDVRDVMSVETPFANPASWPKPV